MRPGPTGTASLLAAALLAAVGLPAAPAAAATGLDDPGCRLAVAAAPDVRLYQPPGGSDEATDPPRRCDFDRVMTFADDASHPPDVPRLLCERVVACGRAMHVLRVGERAYLAAARDYTVVETAAERHDVPDVRRQAPDVTCAETVTTSQRAWFYALAGDNLASATVSDARALDRGAPVAACRFLGDHVIGWHAGQRGLIAVADLAGTCARRDAGYFSGTEPRCGLPAWRATMTQTGWLYPLEDGDATATRAVLPVHTEVVVRAQRPGARGRLAWYEVEHRGARGLVVASAVAVGAPTTYAPDVAVTGCAETAPLVQTTCRVTLPVTRWADPSELGAPPRAIELPPGVAFPIVEAGGGTRSASVLGVIAHVPAGACVEAAGGSLALRLTEERREAAGACPLEGERASLGEIPAERLMDRASPKAQELALLLARSERVANLLGSAARIFEETPVALADFLFLRAHAATDRVLVTLVSGEDGHLTPLHRAVYTEYGVGAQPPGTEAAPAPSPAPICRDETPASPQDDALLVFAADAFARGQTLAAREAHLDVLATTRSEDAAATAVAGYRAAALAIGATRRAVPPLRARCLSGGPRVASDACWLGAMAAFDLGDAADAAPMVDKLARFEGLSARKQAFLTVYRIATGRSSDPNAIGFELLRALSAARARCGDCSELVPALEAQLAYAAHDALDYELAYELLLGLPAPMLLEHLELALSTLTAMARYDEVLDLLEAARWGTAGGIQDPVPMLLYGAVALDEACSFAASGRVASGAEAWLEEREAATASVPAEARDPRAMALSWWTGDGAVSQDAPMSAVGRRLPEVGRLWASGGTCATWRAAAAQLAALDAPPAEGAAPPLAVPPALRPKLRAAVAEAEGDCRAALAAALEEAPQRTRALANALNEYRIDLGDHIIDQLNAGGAILARIDEIARARFRRDAAGVGLGADKAWGPTVKRLPWPFALRDGEVAAADALLRDRGEAALGELRMCGAAASAERETSAITTAGEARADLEAAEYDYESGVDRVDDAVAAAVACLREAVDAELGGFAIGLLVRYQPALQLVGEADLEGLDLDDLPRAVATELRARAARNAPRARTCCLSERPGVTELLHRGLHETSTPSDRRIRRRESVAGTLEGARPAGASGDALTAPPPWPSGALVPWRPLTQDPAEVAE